METTPWDFMSPWMDILRPYASVRPIPKVHSFGGAPSFVSCFGGAPSFVSCVECINLSFPATVPQVDPPEIEENHDFQEWLATSVLTREELVALRAAIGLASRALLISPQLWSAFSDASGSRREDHYFEPRVFRDEDLVPMFEIDSRCWRGEGVAFCVWLTYVKTIFESEEDPRFLRDMQKIEKLDPLGLARGCNGRARVSLRASLMTEAHLEEFVQTLEQFLTRSTPPTLELAGVHLSAKEITSNVIKCLSRLRQLSVNVSSFVVITGTRTRLVSRALAVLQVPELSQKLEVCIARNGTLPCLANSALLDRNAPGFIAVRLDEVNLRFDWKLFNSVIHRACIRIPSQRLYFRLPTLWGQKTRHFCVRFLAKQAAE